jgi:hypothetical protein
MDRRGDSECQYLVNVLLVMQVGNDKGPHGWGINLQMPSSENYH